MSFEIIMIFLSKHLWHKLILLEASQIPFLKPMISKVWEKFIDDLINL